VSCLNCQEIERIEEGNQPWAVARLTTGYVWMNSTQYFEGLTFFVSRWCVDELFDLERERRIAHLYEMTEVAAAVRDAFGASKMNYEALGNSVPHLHWWLTPRRRSDPRPRGPIWEDLDFLRAEWTKEPAVPESRRQALRSSLSTTLATRDLTIERAFL
jgi:diadenosine tetraphosphate (Ap4A) HIT family hydrolase